MRSGAPSGSDGSTSIGTSVKSRLAQPPRIVGVFGALRPSVRARWTWREMSANYPSARHGLDGMEQWLWAERKTSNRRKPRGSDRAVPPFVVTYPCPAAKKYPKSRAVIHPPGRATDRFFGRANSTITTETRRARGGFSNKE